MKVTFNNINNYILWFKLKILIKSCLKILGQPHRYLAIELSFVNSVEMAKLNLKYRGIDKATDVLSFPYLTLNAGKIIDIKSHKSDFDPDINKLRIGDIIICNQLAKDQAEQFGHSYLREISFLVLHGLLHLLGYDHIDESQEEIMNLICEKVLIKNKIIRGNNEN